jgi:hypothetical protein
VHREGEEELGTSHQREVQPGQGRGKGVVLPAHRGSVVRNRQPCDVCTLGMGGFGVRQIAGSRPDRWLVRARWGSHLGTACRGRHHRPGGQRPLPLYVTEQGRGEKREGEREELGFKLNFLKISNRNLKNSKHKSCREFENLQIFLAQSSFEPRFKSYFKFKTTRI